MFIVYAIIIFALLIFVHELGHFISARIFNVTVNEFALGMGPTILKKDGKKTKYALRAIPIGGFCAMEGEDEASDDPNAFNNKSAPKKAVILFAGSLMNFILAILIVSIMIFSLGEPSNKIGKVNDNTPAKTAGLKKGDTIIKIGDKKINKYADISDVITGSKGNQLKLTVKNSQNKVRSAIVTPKKDTDGVYRIGIVQGTTHTVPYFFKSFYYGTVSIFNMTGRMYQAIIKLFTGKESVDNLTGPVGIVKVIAKSSSEGFLFILNITALISLNLAIVNLLPFPALDGGRLLLLVLRKFFKKSITDKIEGKIHLVGIVILFSLMILITFKDVVNLF